MKSKLISIKLLKSICCLFLLLGAGLAQAAGPVCAPTFGPVDTANNKLVTLTANCNPGVGDNIATEGHKWEAAAPGPNSPFIQILLADVASGSATANVLTVNLPAEGTKYRVTATSVGGGTGSASPAVSVYSGAPSCMLKSVYPTVSDTATTITSGASAVLMPVCVAATSVDWYTDKPAINTLIPAPPGGMVSPAETAQYYVVANNSYGSSGSNAVAVTVNAAAPAKPLCSLNAEPLNINAGAAVKLVATCLGATSFDWTGAGAPGSSTAGAITVTPTGDAGAKTYTVVGKNGGIASDPASVVVNVSALPLSACTAISPATASVMVGSASPLLTATGCTNSPTAYVWKVGATPLSCTGVTCTVPPANLPAAGAYSVTVTANNANGSGNVAATATITVAPAALPAAPTITSVTAGSGSVTVAFTPGSLNGGTLTGYQLTCQDPNKVNKWGSGTMSPVVVTGLTNGTVYRCFVRTQTNVGYSSWSVQSDPATPALAAAVPLSECSAIDPATQTVAVGNASGIMTATCSNNPSAYVWKVDGVTQQSSVSPSYTIPASANGSAATKTVTVTANNGGGTGNVSASATVTVAATSSATSYCGTTSNALRLTSAATTATILSNTNTWWTNLAGQSGQNHNLAMSRGQSRSIEFTTGAVGTFGNFLFDNSTVGQPVPKFINLSDKRCDFSYAQADSVEYSGVNSSACTGAARFVVQAAGSPPVEGRCSLLPNKTYFLNIRNENIALSKGSNQRGVDSCIYNGCGFLMQFNPN